MSSKKDGSQKFFTLHFLDNSKQVPKSTKISAKKGKTLKDSVEQVFTSYDFSFETHSVFLDTSKTPLPMTSDVFMYGGCKLNIRDNKDADLDERIIHMIKEEERKSPERTKRYSDVLLHYLSHGFEEDETDGGSEFEKVSQLENSWRDIVDGHEEMESTQRVQQDSIWEILTTERSYLQDIYVIISIFKKCFYRSQAEGFLQEVDPFLLFANIDQVYEVNKEFWNLLINVIKNSRETKKPLKPSELVHAFDKFEELFQPYIQFCNQDTTNAVFPEYSEQTNKDLKNFYNWCDEHPRCKRIKLQGFMIKPLQRVTKYSLLLRAVERKTIDESEKLMLDNTMSRVETFVSKINSAVHLRQEHEKLLSVVAKLETYSPVEPVNEEAEKIMNEFCKLDLKGKIPGLPSSRKRFIVKEGPLKLIEKNTKKEIQAFLFTDVFIIARLKKNTDKYKVIRQPFQLNRVLIKVLKDPGSFLFMYMNDYEVITNAFLLQINSHEQAMWLTAIEKAKKDYIQAIADEERRLQNVGDEDETTLIDDNVDGKKQMRNRFSKRNSTLRGGSNTVSTEITNTRLLLFAFGFLVINILTKYLIG